MSWIDKEVKRRSKQKSAAPRRVPSADEVRARIRALWERLEAANDSLPEPLRLQADRHPPKPALATDPVFEVWLRAPDGAALGLSADGIRYIWPKQARKRSNNLWLRWEAEPERYLVTRRVGVSPHQHMDSWPLDESRLEVVVRRLVQGRLLRVKDLRRRRFWLF